MEKEKVMAIISSMEMQLASLKELVNAEECVVNENPVEETPVIDSDEDITLPDPPSEIHIDMPEDNAPDEECVLGCQIITSLPDFYKGKCSVLRLHKQYFDNGQPKLYINKYRVVVIALDDKMHEIGRIVTHWNNLAKFHAELTKKGINTHTGENWMPKVINLDLD